MGGKNISNKPELLSEKVPLARHEIINIVFSKYYSL